MQVRSLAALVWALASQPRAHVGAARSEEELKEHGDLHARPGMAAPEFDLARVKLSQTGRWSYMEGSYGGNPEYGETHALTLAAEPTEGDHTEVRYERGSNVDRTAKETVVTFWEIATTGEAWVPRDVSATGTIGHTHTVSLAGDELTVTVTYGETGERRTTKLSVAALYAEFVSQGGLKPLKFEF
mmetsp:Transcript_7119/g.19840  ORF Transcript_7119/g.19840 Transcript_7119/m.19840 type:complete len:186 (+) Transcript_7119:91-648(+)